MSETIEAAPVTDTVAEPEVVIEAAPVAEATDTPEATPEPEAEKPAPKKDWRETRIDQLTREKHEARRELEALRAAQAKPGEPAPVDTDIERRAAQIVEQREYSAKVETWAKKGSTEFKDFNERCATVAGLGLAPSERPEFMQTIADMDDGHKLVAHLADHPEAAMALAKMSGPKMGRELERLSISLQPKPAPVSKAPAPVSSPTGAVKTAPDLADPKMSAADFAKLFADTTKLKGFKR